jgi:ribose 5-phosphate isomerase A
MDLKKEAAAKAITLISDNSTVGLGAGSTIAYMVDFLKKEIENGLQVKFVTSSFSTRQLLLQNQFYILSAASLDKIDIYFDGCDQLDKKLNALKSGGGIHTQEKLLACMANLFVLIGDETKLVENFDTRFPLVIEILPEAFSFAPAKIPSLFQGVRSAYRISDKKDGLVMTDNGNYLLDIWFDKWPDLTTINPVLKTLTGVVETSLFYNLADKAIIAGEDGVKILE